MQEIQDTKSTALGKVNKIFLLATFVWTSLIFVLSYFSYVADYENAILSAKTAAANAFQKDLVYRKWASIQGGVYVPITDHTPPNPHLAHIPERDVETTSGKKLTLVNPAYMTREVLGLGEKEYGLKGHITSLNPIRPENSADDWERKALQAFEAGDKELHGLEMIGDQKYFRYVAPMVTHSSCLKCHAHQGYKEGDLRGGISVSVPWAPFHSSLMDKTKVIVGGYGIIWVFGLAGIFGARRVISSQISSQQTALDAMARSERMLNTVLQTTSAGIGLLKDRVIQWGNDGLLEITGYSKDEIQLQPSKKFYETEEEFERAGTIVYPEIAAKGKSTVETRFRRKDGSITEVLMNVAAVDNTDPAAGVVFVIVDIGEFNKMTKELHNNVQRMEKAEIAAKFGNWELNLTSGKMKGSRGALNIYGLMEQEIGLETVQKIPLPEYRAKLDAALSGLIHNQSPYDIEFKAVRQSDGKIIDVHSIAEFDPKTNVIRGVIQDISKQKQAEEALAERELLYRTLFEGARESIIIIDMERDSIGRIVSANPAAARMHGYSLDELTSLRLADIEVPDATRDFQTRVDTVLSGRSLKMEMDHQRKDGSVFPIEISANLIEIRGHKYCLGIDRNINERKEAEKALRESESQFRSYVEASPIAIYETDSQGRMLSANKAAIAIIGYTTDDMLQMNVMDPVPHEHLSKCLEAFELINNIGSASLDTELTKSSGEKIWITVSGVKLSEDRYLFFGQDISDRKKAQEELIEMERRLLQSQKLESLGVLSGGIAHDFNNLLAVIIGNIELAQDDESNLPETRKFLDSAMVASQKSAGLIRQMLDYSGRGAFKLEEINLPELVENNAEMFRLTVPKNINLRIEPSDEDIIVLADLSQIQQVIMNLLINSSEAFEEKNGTVQISTGVLFCDEALLSRSLLLDKPAPQKMAFIRVRDGGGGMDSQTINRIFDPFFSTKFTGRGLGMSVVHGVVRGHNGVITIDSQLGSGTTVTIYLPVLKYAKKISEVKTGLTPAFSPGPESSKQHKKLVVLVVDDEPRVVGVVTSQLQKIGCETFSATNGKEAIEFLSNNPDVDMVLLDLVMPEMGGVETFHAIKKIDPMLRVVMCSGYNQEKFAEEFPTDQRPDAFLGKPFSFSEIKILIEQMREPSEG